jgi:hypothetical protein
MENANELCTYLTGKLPPMFTRQEATKHLGGIFHFRTLRNLDYKGRGPTGKQHLGRNKVIYFRDNFIEWLRDYLENKLS